MGLGGPGLDPKDDDWLALKPRLIKALQRLDDVIYNSEISDAMQTGTDNGECTALHWVLADEVHTTLQEIQGGGVAMSNAARPLPLSDEDRLCQTLNQAHGITQTLQWALETPAEEWHQESAIAVLWAVDDLLKESIDLLCKRPDKPADLGIPN